MLYMKMVPAMRKRHFSWITVGLFGVAGSVTGATEFSFERFYVDFFYGGNGKPGWIRAGDMDGEGDTGLVAGGGRALFIYENDGKARGWKRHGSLDSTGNIGANGAVLLDVDGDKDLDVVCAKYYEELGWWENPGGSLADKTWAFHQLAEVSYYLHDMILVDLDGDGKATEVIANLISGGNLKLLWWRPAIFPVAASRQVNPVMREWM